MNRLLFVLVLGIMVAVVVHSSRRPQQGRGEGLDRADSRVVTPDRALAPAAPVSSDRSPAAILAPVETALDPPARPPDSKDPGAETVQAGYELFEDWPLHEREVLLRRRLQLVTMDRYAEKFAAGQYQVVDARYLKQLVEDASGRPRPTSLRYVGDEQQLVVLSEQECPEAWAIMSALKENRAAIREYEQELERIAEADPLPR